MRKLKSIITRFANPRSAPLVILVSLVVLSAAFLVARQLYSAPANSDAVAVPLSEPSLSLASATVMQNGDLKLSLEGFAPGELVLVRANDSAAGSFKEIGRAKADVEGRVGELTIKMPVWLTSGARTIEALGQNSGRRAESIFYVRAEKPWIDLGAYAAKQDGSIAFVAGGFEPGEKISTFFEGQQQNPLASVEADQAGNTKWTEFSIRGIRPGQYNLILRGDSSQTEIARSVTISPRSPWVDLHVYAIGPGGSIGFDGHDFAPNEDVTVFLDEMGGTPLTTAQADESGNFTVSKAYTAKPSDVGRHRIIFTGALTTGDIRVAFDVTPFTPAFHLTTYSGPTGTETSFNGYGFAPNETIRVLMQGQEQPVATIQADQNGSFEDAGRFMIPRDANGGNLGLMLVGEASGVRLTQEFSVVRIQPFLGLDTYAGPPGTLVHFRGLGFAAEETVVVHLINREGPLVAKFVTDKEGRFERAGTYSIPGDATQDVRFMAIGQSSRSEASVSFQVILSINER